MFIRYFVFLSKVLGVHLYLNQRERHLFVTVNDTAKISCFLTEDNPDVGRKLLWFWRGTEETVTFVVNCYGNKSDGKYHCRHEPRSATLEIHSAQRNESGVYYCAYPIVNKLKFAEGSALIVGGKHHRQSVATGAQTESPQGDILYADLDFDTKNPMKHRHRGQHNGKKK
ncbi:hypothetical protein NDU88_001090 [Pleurodeles waltl]|uniref:Ig-like domain-containing protein n=1 Tax=Pleurodeles waltl TaxID=8319 RepID=A0AAV7KNJ7_PLEWA|nr:hypothetical protein NDU88_001090 [Pleurodeles waltl]